MKATVAQQMIEEVKRSVAFILLVLIATFVTNFKSQQPTDNSPDTTIACLLDERPWVNQTCTEIPYPILLPLCFNNSELLPLQDNLICQEPTEHRAIPNSLYVFCPYLVIQEMSSFDEKRLMEFELAIHSLTDLRVFEKEQIPQRFETTERQIPYGIPKTEMKDCTRRVKVDYKGARLLMDILLTEKCVVKGGRLGSCTKGELLCVTTGKNMKRRTC